MESAETHRFGTAHGAALRDPVQKGPRFVKPVLAPVPLFVLQPVLARIVRNMAADKPELFNRIGVHTSKTYLIDPVNMPFALILQPRRKSPRLYAVRRRSLPPYDARIAGSFLTLLDMIDGRLDGDALFFSRELVVEGDTEAVVCLRNALDDLEGSAAEDVAALFGLPGRAALKGIRQFRGEGQ